MPPSLPQVRSSETRLWLIDRTRRQAGSVVSGPCLRGKFSAISRLRQVIAKKGNFSLDSFVRTGKMARLSRGYVAIHQLAEVSKVIPR